MKFFFTCIYSVTAILSVLTKSLNCERISGLYVDNGFDKTLVHRVATRKEKRAITRDILNLLDLPVQPYSFLNKSSLREPSSASQYIYDIYRSTLENAEGAVSKPIDLEVIRKSDVIITYEASEKSEGAYELEFELSETPVARNIVSAELRIYLRESIGEFKLSVHVQTQSNGLRLVDTLNVTSSNNKGWLKLDALEALRHWLSYDKYNKGILRLSAVALGVEIDQKLNFIVHDFDRRPFLVGYFANLQDSAISQSSAAGGKSRSKRNSDGILPGYLDSVKNPYVLKDSSRGRKIGLDRGGCRMRSLYVRFRDLEYDKYIVAPDGYDARFCIGDCRFPLNAHVNATNHALVQTLVHFLKPGRAPQVACAPKQLAHLPVLYSRDGLNHVLKKYKNMVVQSCGCH